MSIMEGGPSTHIEYCQYIGSVLDAKTFAIQD